MYQHIVTGTDLSNTANVATQRAADLASHLGARLTLVYAGSDPGRALVDMGRVYGAETVATPGNPAEVLVAECERLNADLLVVGSVGMSGRKRFLLGSVPNKVSHHASTDLLIVKTDPLPRQVTPYKRVLVGTDGSPTAMRAVEMTSALAKAVGMSEVIATAYEPPSEHELEQLRGDPNDPIAQWNPHRTVQETPEEFKWRIVAANQAEDILERAAERAARHGVDAEVRALKGHPAEVLIETAERERFDLIAVGSVGMRGPRRFMLGNVPHRVSHHAPTDVLILHTG